MTSTIKNLVEVQETDAAYGQALLVRKRNIQKFSALGPPDLCYLTKESSKTFGRTKTSAKIGSYHYAYGVEMSSPACISIYINNLLKNQEAEGGWFSKKSSTTTIKKAVYCVYDAFRRIDIRAEISIPGGMNLYAIDRDERSIAIDGSDWDSVYISAMLRAFNPEKVPHTRFYRELPNKEQLWEFLKAVGEFCKTQDLKFENDELLYFRGGRVLYYVSDYLIRKRRLPIALEFFTTMTKADKRWAAFMVDVFSSMYKYPDSVKLLAPILVKKPHISTLLYQEADSLMKAEKYELALKIAKVVIQLCPDSFEAWFLLAEIFFYSKHYKEALIAINTCPFYLKEPNNDGIAKAKPNQTITPKAHDLCNSYSHYMFEPNWEVYTPTQLNEEIAKLSQDFLEENERILNHMKNLPAARLQPNELKVYKILVKIEREIGWETLLKVRSSIFIMDGDQPKSPSKVNDTSKLEDYSIQDISDIQEKSGVNFVPGLSMNEQSFHAVKFGGECFIDKFREDVETLESVGMEDMPSFLQDENYRRKVSQKGGGKGTPQIYKKVNGPAPDDASRIEEQSDSESIDSNEGNKKYKKYLKEDQYKNRAKFDPFTIMNLEIKSKRLCSRTLETLFVALHEDLNMMYEWQHEANLDKSILHGENDHEAKDEEGKIKYGGLVWVHRGILAERLCRISFAEKAYRNVIDKAISLYALGRLFKLYLDSGNVKAALLCLGEIIEEMEVDGIKKFEFLPNWLEEPLLQTIATIGMTRFNQVLKETNLSNEEAIVILIKQAEYWNIGNSD